MLALSNLVHYSPYEEVLNASMQFVEFSKLKGEYLEFGVYEGKTFIIAFHIAQMRKLHSMNFYAFDSFEGLPEVKGIDSKGFKQFDKGEYLCGLNKFKKNILSKGVNTNKVHIVKGWYDKILTKKTKEKIPLKKAAIIYVDCDFYRSTVSVLRFVTDYIQDGTIIIFDDWFAYGANPERGEQRAFYEWLKQNKKFSATHFFRFGFGGDSFIIHRK